MKKNNALVVSTGQRAPLSLRKPIERIAGDRASVQALDAVARYGLDTSVQQTAFLVGSVADAVGTFNYTVLGGGRVAPDASWVRAHITTQQVPILGSVTCNRVIFPQLTAALNEIIERGLADKIHPSEYAGCYYPRFIAGTTSLSNHSFGLALDLNTPGNQRGTVGEMDRGVVDDLQEVGLRLGRGLALHRPDALRDERRRRPALSGRQVPAVPDSPVACLRMRAVQVTTPTGPERPRDPRRRRARARARRRAGRGPPRRRSRSPTCC